MPDQLYVIYLPHCVDQKITKNIIIKKNIDLYEI